MGLSSVHYMGTAPPLVLYCIETHVLYFFFHCIGRSFDLDLVACCLLPVGTGVALLDSHVLLSLRARRCMNQAAKLLGFPA